MCGVVECGFPIKNDFFLPTIKYKQFLDNILLCTKIKYHYYFLLSIKLWRNTMLCVVLDIDNFVLIL